MGRSSGLLNSGQSVEYWICLVEAKPFSKHKKKGKPFLPPALKMAVSRINHLSTNSFSPANGDLRPSGPLKRRCCRAAGSLRRCEAHVLLPERDRDRDREHWLARGSISSQMVLQQQFVVTCRSIHLNQHGGVLLGVFCGLSMGRAISPSCSRHRR